MAIILLETLLTRPDEQRTICLRDPQKILATNELGKVTEVLNEVDAEVSSGAIAVGFVSYEAGFHFLPGMPPAPPTRLPLVWFAVQHDYKSEALPSFDEEAVTVNQLELDTSADEYSRAIDKIKRHIERGNTYQVNYTIRLKGTYSGSPLGLYRQLRLKQPVPYAAYIETDEWSVLSLSPELFFRRLGNRIVMRPMKGTAPRGRTLEEDGFFAETLASSEKERAENLMIVDLLRNDLGKICEPGSIHVARPLEVERYETVLQMTSTIEGTIQPNRGLSETFHALFPSGSITGAPKIRTMQIIHEIEKSPRQIYTGAIGFVSQNETVFSVAIRTAVVHGPAIEMGIGSGILYEANADREYQECILKARFLTDKPLEFDLIETILWVPEDGYQRIPFHLDRLMSSAEYFSVPLTRANVLNFLEHHQPEERRHCKSRFLVDRNGSMRINFEPLSELQNPSIGWAEPRSDSSNRFLYHKTTNRFEYTKELERGIREGHTDVLFRNERGEVTEGCISNVWILKDSLYYTPPVRCGLLAGTYRRFLLEDPAFPSEERVLFERDVRDADAIFISNAIRGLVKVTLK